METINAFLALLEFNFSMAVVVVGHDSEYADYDNRDGSIFGDSYRVQATVIGGKYDGLQFAHAHCFMNDMPGALAMQSRIEAHVKAGGSLGENCWYEVEPRYGTGAWLTWNAEHPETWND